MSTDPREPDSTDETVDQDSEPTNQAPPGQGPTDPDAIHQAHDDGDDGSQV